MAEKKSSGNATPDTLKKKITDTMARLRAIAETERAEGREGETYITLICDEPCPPDRQKQGKGDCM